MEVHAQPSKLRLGLAGALAGSGRCAPWGKLRERCPYAVRLGVAIVIVLKSASRKLRSPKAVPLMVQTCKLCEALFTTSIRTHLSSKRVSGNYRNKLPKIS